MKKRGMLLRLLVLVCVAALWGAGFGSTKSYAASKEMNIYGLYLKTNDKGDSVLLESKGKYLLMDIGSYSHASAIVTQLKSLKVKKLSLYFSHLHIDHVGAVSGDYLGGLKKIINAGITIDTLYLPAKELAPKSLNNPARYKRIENYMKDKAKIVYLNVGSTFQIGDVSGKIIGPVSVNAIDPNDYTSMATSDDGEVNNDVKYTYYENNCSLAAMFTCGKTKFFTAGDALVDEADFLVNRYKSTLKADIMKLNHHGTGSGNTAALLDAVSPKYTFACNTGLTAVNPTTRKWRTNVARKNTIKHGMCYLIGNEKKTIIYQVKNDKIKVYTGKISNGTMLKGWVSLTGGDGQFRKTDQYYFSNAGVPVTGIKKIGKDYYNFGKGGCMEYGNYSGGGKYLYWKTYSDGRRYYTLSSNKKYAVMAKGFKEVDGILYYFGKNGCSITAKKSRELKKIGSAYYAVKNSGEIVRSDWVKFNGEKYYFGKSGKRVTNKKVKLGENYYYVGSKGKIVRSKSGKRLLKASGTTYGLYKSGKLIISDWATIGGNKYYFGKTGKMVTNKRVKKSNYYYYFGKTGKMVRKKLVKIGNASYYFGKSGRMVTNKRVKISNYYYYFGANGVMYRNTHVDIDGSIYYCQNNGRMALVQ